MCSRALSPMPEDLDITNIEQLADLIAHIKILK
jgi:hypothetical protein